MRVKVNYAAVYIYCMNFHGINCNHLLCFYYCFFCELLFHSIRYSIYGRSKTNSRLVVYMRIEVNYCTYCVGCCISTVLIVILLLLMFSCELLLHNIRYSIYGRSSYTIYGRRSLSKTKSRLVI